MTDENDVDDLPPLQDVLLDRHRTELVTDATEKTRRVVVFDREGKSYEFWAPSWRLDVQDGGRTLKLWAKNDDQ